MNFKSLFEAANFIQLIDRSVYRFTIKMNSFFPFQALQMHPG